MNIVGEDHGERRPHHPNEKKFASDNGYGGFWSESQPFVDGDAPMYGDDPVLRARDAALDILQQFDGIVFALGYAGYEDAVKREKVAWRQTNLDEWADDLAVEAGRIANRDEGRRAEIVGELARDVARIDDLGLLSDAVTTRARIVEQWFPDYPGLQIRDREEITTRRDVHMLASAEAAWDAGMVGVWKVGTSHAKNMLADRYQYDAAKVAVTSASEYEKIVDS